MKCKNIQKMIITDYLDNALNKTSRQKIVQHLNMCKVCRQFSEAVHSTAKQPFENQQYLQPPETVWTAICERIYPIQLHRESLLTKIKHGVTNSLFARRMTLATVAVLSIIAIAIGFFEHSLNKKEMFEAYFTEQATTYRYLQNTNGDFNGLKVNFGTALEEYFL